MHRGLIAPCGGRSLPLLKMILVITIRTFGSDYFKRIHADGALLSAGGVVAFYPTDIPLHHRSDLAGQFRYTWLPGKRMSEK